MKAIPPDLPHPALPMSDIRFSRLYNAISDLLLDLYHLGIDPDELDRAKQTAESATPATIGTVIHHLHTLRNEARTRRAEDEIEACIDDNEIEYQI